MSTRFSVTALTGLPEVVPGDDLHAMLAAALAAMSPAPGDGDIVVIAQKIVSKAEGRFEQLADVTPGDEACALATRCDKDPRLVELILRESRAVVRCGPGVLIVEHVSGHIMANAGIDRSNVRGDDETVLLLPRDPDGWCESFADALRERLGRRLGVVMSDSFGRPWRLGTAGVAIGAAGIVARHDVRGRADRLGRPLEVTEIGLADEIAAAASLLMGQADEGLPVCVVSGLDVAGNGRAADLLRASERDLLLMAGSGGHVLALAGGVGGAKLVTGLDRHLRACGRADALSVVVNTGDDFEHLGLYVCPDLDSVTYALADLNDRERGWGLRDETWRFMAALERLGGETWFALGDQDLATHVERTRLLGGGATLSAVTRHLTAALGIRNAVAPMCDTPVRTRVLTDAGELAFQHYFVRERCEPAVRGFRFDGADAARPSALLAEALARTDLSAVVICPSNPFISIDPMLAIPGLRAALEAVPAPVVAVSPIVGGTAVKGPAAKMLGELGLAVDAAGIAAHYGDLLDGFVVDDVDAGLDATLAPLPVLACATLMRAPEDAVALAARVLDWCATLSPAA